MNILFTINDGYAQHLAVVIESIKSSNPEEDINCFILTEYISNTNRVKLSQATTNSLIKLTFINIEFGKISSYLKVDKHAAPANYYRLFSTEFLPRKLKKVIYLDTDLIVLSSLKPLWETKISNYALAAVHSYNEERMGVLNLQYYYNSGVLLMNLEYWRENRLIEIFTSFIKSHPDKIKFWDQDVINHCLKEHILPLDDSWNYCNTFNKRKKINILHFAGMHKPWDNHYKKDINTKIYFRYLFHTKYWSNRFLLNMV